MKFLSLGIIPLVVLHISSIFATKPGQNVKMMALTMMGLREALCWKAVRVFWYYLNSFWPSLCKIGTVLHFFGPYFFLSDRRHNIRNWKIRSAFFQEWVYASNIQFWGFWTGALVYSLFDITLVWNVQGPSKCPVCLAFERAVHKIYLTSLTRKATHICCDHSVTVIISIMSMPHASKCSILNQADSPQNKGFCLLLIDHFRSLHWVGNGSNYFLVHRRLLAPY